MTVSLCAATARSAQPPRMRYTLVAEGNANTILRTPGNELIRVSKRGADPYAVAAYWNETWRPRLGRYMGRMEPIEDPEHGPVLLIDEVGGRGVDLVAQFKPKWLHQSVAAPLGARSCRTCAIKAMRGQENHWCSLDLAAKDSAGLQRCMQSAALPEHVAECVQLLEQTDLLDALALWQARLDTAATLADCMSLRDCTVMIEHRPGVGYTCRLVDLDPKGGAEKLEKWHRLENELQPYYLRDSAVCRLSRRPQPSPVGPAGLVSSASVGGPAG